MTLARVTLLASTWKPIVLGSFLLASKVRYLLVLLFQQGNTTESKKYNGLRIEMSPKAFSSVCYCTLYVFFLHSSSRAQTCLFGAPMKHGVAIRDYFPRETDKTLTSSCARGLLLQMWQDLSCWKGEFANMCPEYAVDKIDK